MVDNDMYPILSKYKWHAKKSGSGNTWYAESARWNYKFGVRRIKLHHVIVGFPIRGLFPDHIDRNGLNNQRSNLRLVTRTENNRNEVHHNQNTPKHLLKKSRLAAKGESEKGDRK